MPEEQVPCLAQIAIFALHLAHSTLHNSLLHLPALVFPFQGVGHNVGKAAARKATSDSEI